MIVKRYGDRAAFLAEFNPDVQIKICTDEELCYFGDAPTLASLNLAYGKMTAAMWLVPQLYNLSEFCGCKNKLEGKALEECASLIAMQYHWLKVSELMLFFVRFKLGRYSVFYGSVDPLVITTSLRSFLKERNLAYERRENAIRNEEIEESKKRSITWEEYCEKEGREGEMSPIDKLLGAGKRKQVKNTESQRFK